MVPSRSIRFPQHLVDNDDDDACIFSSSCAPARRQTRHHCHLPVSISNRLAHLDSPLHCPLAIHQQFNFDTENLTDNFATLLSSEVVVVVDVMAAVHVPVLSPFHAAAGSCLPSNVASLGCMVTPVSQSKCPRHASNVLEG